MLSTLEIHERRSSDQVTLALQGELDFCSGAELASKLVRASSCEQARASKLADEGRLGARIVVDLTELEFLDSAGMGVLHRAALWAGEEGWTLDLTGPRPNVAHVLRLTNLA
jgi:anti-anti-sigma factor